MLNLRQAIRDFESVSAAWSEFLQQLHQIHEGLLNVPNISVPPRQRGFLQLPRRVHFPNTISCIHMGRGGIPWPAYARLRERIHWKMGSRPTSVAM